MCKRGLTEALMNACQRLIRFFGQRRPRSSWSYRCSCSEMLLSLSQWWIVRSGFHYANIIFSITASLVCNSDTATSRHVQYRSRLCVRRNDSVLICSSWGRRFVTGFLVWKTLSGTQTLFWNLQAKEKSQDKRATIDNFEVDEVWAWDVLGSLLAADVSDVPREPTLESFLKQKKRKKKPESPPFAREWRSPFYACRCPFCCHFLFIAYVIFGQNVCWEWRMTIGLNCGIWKLTLIERIRIFIFVFYYQISLFSFPVFLSCVFCHGLRSCSLLAEFDGLGHVLDLVR